MNIFNCIKSVVCKLAESKLEKLLNEWFDRTVPWPLPDPNKLQGQCVQFIRWLLQNYWKLPQWVGQPGAADFWKSYEWDTNISRHWEKIPYFEGFIPIEGDIFIQDKSKGGGFGHIGVAIGYNNTAQKFSALEQNYKPLVVTRVERNYNAILGFFRRKEQ